LISAEKNQNLRDGVDPIEAGDFYELKVYKKK
jgi:hypothetical protein